MRDDMAKVLVERPRVGGGVKFPRNAAIWQRLGPDELPPRESVKFRWGRSGCRRKWLNENLAPLRRFLRSRRGRPWDEVYGEICERINRDSAVQLHIWQHLMWEVVRDPVQLELWLSRAARRGGSFFYVDPATGRFEEHESKRRARPWRPRSVPFLVTCGGRFYREVDGLWFEIELAPLRDGDEHVRDMLLSGKGEGANLVSRRQLQETYGRCVLAVKKRQLNKREIRRLTAALASAADRRS